VPFGDRPVVKYLWRDQIEQAIRLLSRVNKLGAEALFHCVRVVEAINRPLWKQRRLFLPCVSTLARSAM
jgi:hypothetical protein